MPKGHNGTGSKTRSSKSAQVAQVGNDIKALEQRLKELRKHQRELLKKAGGDIKSFRHDVSQLKKLGVVAKRTDARKQEPTRYMRARVRKFYDAIVGTHIPVRAKPAVRREYSDKGIFEERGAFLMVPRESPKQRVKVTKEGKIKISEPIGPKTIRQGGVRINRIVLPYSAANLLDLAQKIEADPSLPSELDGADQYAFTLFGHKSLKAFPNKQELVDHITKQYSHLFKGPNQAMGVKHFALITYSGGSNYIPDTGDRKFYSQRGKGKRPNATGRNYNDSWFQNQQRDRRATREKQKRAKMSNEQREAYNAKSKQRAQAWRNKQKAKDFDW